METSVKRTNYFWPVTKFIAAILSAIAIAAIVVIQESIYGVVEPEVEFYSWSSQFIIVLISQLTLLLLAVLPLSIVADYLVQVKWQPSGVRKILVVACAYIVVGIIAGILYSIFTMSVAYGSSILFIIGTTFVFLAIQLVFDWILSRLTM
ncbi:hypothetical protein CQS04_05325 [Chryseomicrobium excrementi]|uniref:Uncharacterized protein n=1 Tax=Chryseomicrobium excrementi TaxID=2041346 RepID=A0A2M9EZF3_9BACL|nr:hypothetical protein [Chryseomicrobium excrementi]PJK16579.1 hypothetical protein CQS04_05325 [Chryseomicrobium excrementi]